MGHRFGFWAAIFAFAVLLAFSTAPSPLYALYARRDGFSSLTITLIYAAYAIGVAVSLVLAGHLSDTRGRRPILLAALAIAAASAVAFLAWPDLTGLIVARVLTGLAVGITSSTATAYLTELHAAHRNDAPPHRAQLAASAANVGGIGLGALISGLLAQYTASPLTIPYVAFLIAIAATAAAVGFAPETRPVARIPYRPQRPSIPPTARTPFIAALAGIVVAFAVLGMFVGLAGTFLSGTLHRNSPALAGATVCAAFAAGVIVLAAGTSWPTRRKLLTGVPLMLVGLALLVADTWFPTLALFLVSAAVIGAGACAVFSSALATAVAASPKDRLAECLATFFLAGYGGLTVPVVALGVALHGTSTRTTLIVFASVIAVVAIAATPAMLSATRRGQGGGAPARGSGGRPPETNAKRPLSARSADKGRSDE